jgi:hypothetical protein
MPFQPLCNQGNILPSRCKLQNWYQNPHNEVVYSAVLNFFFYPFFSSLAADGRLGYSVVRPAPSFMYSWSISHILEHDFFFCWGGLEQCQLKCVQAVKRASCVVSHKRIEPKTFLNFFQ